MTILRSTLSYVECVPHRLSLALAFFAVFAGFAAFAGSASAAGSKTSSLRFSHRTHYDHNVECEKCHVIGPDLSAPPPVISGWVPLQPSRILHPPQIVIEGEPTGISDIASRTGIGIGAGNGNGAGGGADNSAGSGAGSGATSAAPLGIPPAPTFGRPSEKTCMQCHFRKRRNKECGLCHLEAPGPTDRERVRLPKRTRFPHEVHVKTDCLDCHTKINDWETLDGKMQDSSMAGCLACHNGVKAKKSCTMCHDPVPRPLDHVRNYENKHGLAFRDDPRSCRACHEDSSCVACHTLKPRSHSLAWVSRRHGLTAMSDPDSCKACHTDPHICLRCHDAWKGQ